MKFTFEINKARYRDTLNEFVRVLGADAEKLLREEMRLFLREIIRFTPPKTNAQGRKAVEGDIQKAIGLLDQNSFGRAREEVRLPMRELIRRRDNETLQEAMREMDGRYWIVKTFDKNDHISRRNRYGRVRRKSFVMTTDRTAYNRYVREVKGRVGYAKSGWLKAAEAVGLPLPSWVRRHAGYAKGGFEAPTANKLEIVARNGSVRIPNYERTVSSALNSRRMSVEKEFARLLRGGKTRRASLAGTTYSQPATLLQ